MQLAQESLCRLIPHHGSMCLLKKVDFFDDENITRLADSHRLDDNPLRDDLGLSSINGIEYGAQAIAIHAALTRQQDESSSEAQSGYLVQVKNVSFTPCDLSLKLEYLKIEATQVLMTERNLIYSFAVSHEGERLVEGRITIFMSAPNDIE